jgi:arginine exporter protein ArgO
VREGVGRRPVVTGVFGAGVVAGLGVAMPMGAIGVLLLGLPARAGTSVAVAAALGVATTDGLYALVAVAGGASVATPLRSVSGALRIASAVVLVVLAVVTVAAARRNARDTQRRIRLTTLRAYLGLIALTAVNPATLAYFVALVVGIGGSLHSAGAPWFVLGVLVASASWQLALVGGGTTLAHVIGTPSGRRWMSLVSAAVMIGFATKVALLR